MLLLGRLFLVRVTPTVCNSSLVGFARLEDVRQQELVQLRLPFGRLLLLLSFVGPVDGRINRVDGCLMAGRRRAEIEISGSLAVDG